MLTYLYTLNDMFIYAFRDFNVLKKKKKCIILVDGRVVFVGVHCTAIIVHMRMFLCLFQGPCISCIRVCMLPEAYSSCLPFSRCAVTSAA